MGYDMRVPTAGSLQVTEVIDTIERRPVLHSYSHTHAGIYAGKDDEDDDDDDDGRKRILLRCKFAVDISRRKVQLSLSREPPHIYSFLRQSA